MSTETTVASGTLLSTAVQTARKSRSENAATTRQTAKTKETEIASAVSLDFKGLVSKSEEGTQNAYDPQMEEGSPPKRKSGSRRTGNR